MTRHRCEICESSAPEPYFVKRGFQFVRCAGCGHVSVDGAAEAGALENHYGRGFFEGGDYADYARDRAILQRNFRRFTRRLAAFSAGGRLFEIGCAYGFFLDVARARWDVSGIDIAAEAVDYARGQLGLPVVHGDFLDLAVSPDSVDVVAMWDTIEHLERPAAYVAKASAMLKPGGVLALTTGDVGSPMARLRGAKWRLYHPPSHLHYFSTATMARLLRRHGLEPVHVAHVGYSRSLDTMLHRLLSAASRDRLGRLMSAAGLTRLAEFPLYLNLFDIMFVVARKS